MRERFRVLCNKTRRLANRLLHKIRGDRSDPGDESDSWSEHHETYGDDSPRGEHYPDDRTKLAYVYDGESLKAALFDEREVKRYREETTFVVSLTPAGEARVGGDR